MFSTMSGETCSTLAQVVPVLLLAFVVELRGLLFTRRVMASASVVSRIPTYFIALSLAGYVIMFGASEVLVVWGVEKGGLNGELAGIAWFVFILLLVYTLVATASSLWKGNGRNQVDDERP